MTGCLGFVQTPHHPAALRFGIDVAADGAPQQDVNWHAKMALEPVDPLGNDKRGCCVEAGMYRLAQMWMANAGGSSWRPTTKLVLDAYSAWTGFDQATGQPDVGTPLDVAQAKLAQQGLDLGLQELDVALPVAVDPQNLDHVRGACRTFGGLWLALNLPAAWKDGGTTWDVAGDPGGWGRHLVPTGRCERRGLFWVISWGLEIELTPAALAKYCIQAGAAASRLWFDTTGQSPAGLDWDATLAAARAVS